ncbi:MAG: formate dehydrogenase accessory protein FdhE [Deltaproteobacteria bacterium]|nr:MAG: formate dehydrogenase accessory protein FdhE [Deltaproteobacteria bacterium]
MMTFFDISRLLPFFTFNYTLRTGGRRRQHPRERGKLKRKQWREHGVGVSRVERRVAYLSRVFPWLSDLFRAYSDITRMSGKGGGARWDPPGPVEVLVGERVKRGFPLLRAEEVSIDAEALRELSVYVLTVLSRWSGIMSDLLDSALSGRIPFPEAAMRFLARDERYFERDLSLDEVRTESLFFVLARALNPQMRGLVRELRDHLEGVPWEEAFCPVCGFLPLVGFFPATARGNRTELNLVCSLCENFWVHPPRRCLLCGAGEEGDFLTFHGRGGFVRCCLSCNSYVKFITVESPPDEASFPLEDMATVTLDIRANNLGFSRRGVFRV